MKNEPYTICRLTPPGIGAIAVVRLEGQGAFSAINRCFRRHSESKQSLNEPFLAQSVPVSGLVYGQLYDPGNIQDLPEDIVLARIDADSFEINCHGGSAAVDRAIRILSGSSGNETVLDGQDWLVNQFVGGDKVQGKIAALLTQSKTWKTTAVLLDQYQGAWRRSQDEIASLEAAGAFAQAQEKRERINRFCKLGRRLTRPWRVALTGKPNAGKSSLLNCLLGFDRAIVNETRGTTRDVVSAETVLDGWPFELVDTAGIRQSSDPLELAGIDRAIQQIESSDLVLELHAADELRESIEQTRNDWPRVSIARINIITKSDLENGSCSAISDNLLRISVKTRTGIDSLIRLIVNTLIPEQPGPGDAVPLDFS